MGTTKSNKSLEELKKELLNMHKQFDNLLENKELSNKYSANTTEIDSNTKPLDKNDITNNNNYKYSLEKASSINDEEQLIEVTEIYEDLKEETEQEIIEFRKQQENLQRQEESQRTENQYLSIKEKLDRIKREISAKELEISKKTTEAPIQTKNNSIQQIKNQEETKIEISTNKENIKDIPTTTIAKKTIVQEKNSTTKDKKKSLFLNIIIMVLSLTILTLIYFLT